MRYIMTAVTVAALACGLTPPLGLTAVGAEPGVERSGAPVEPMRLTTTETLVGTWTGRWHAAGGAGGSVGLVLGRVPGRDTVVGQFTFVTGAVSRTVRYEGRLEDGAVRFPLVDDGRIVLEAEQQTQRPVTADRLSGSWVERRGALPAHEGTLELERAS